MHVLRFRQVHLDFHTSEHIPGVGSEFNADEFVDTLKRAHVNSVTLFSRCHHGWIYHETRFLNKHPHLTCDLLALQIEACHRHDIRCPIYITVGWDALLTQNHPEWRAMFKNGLFGDWNSGHPGQWKFVNWLHPGAQQHILREGIALVGTPGKICR